MANPLLVVAAQRRAANEQWLTQVLTAAEVPPSRIPPLVETIAMLPTESAAPLIAEALPPPDRHPEALPMAAVAFHLQRACLSSQGTQVSQFLARRSTDWLGMTRDDADALIQWVSQGVDRKSDEWQVSANLVSTVAREVYRQPDIPNIWDCPELFAWRDRHPVVEVADLIDLFQSLELQPCAS